MPEHAIQSDSLQAFAYTAQSREGLSVSGTIDAVDADEARWRLNEVGLRVLVLRRAGRPSKTKSIRSNEFLAFNQQLAHLTESGMPLEQGLRLIATDIDSTKQSNAISAIADSLESGDSLAEAFEKHSSVFPALYGRVIQAGVKSGNLSGILLNLGQHFELIQRLRRTIWNAATYPLVILIMFLIILSFIGAFLAPQMEAQFDNFTDLVDDAQSLPLISRFVFAVAEFIPYFTTVFVLSVVAVWFAWSRQKHPDAAIPASKRRLLRFPLIGRVLCHSLTARWCGAVGMGVRAGLDLPAAISLAADAVGTNALAQDSQILIKAHSEGRPLETVDTLTVLSPSVIVAMDLAMQRNDLIRALSTLTQMYRDQAEQRLETLSSVLRPMLIIVAGAVIAVAILGIFVPLVQLIETVTSSINNA